MENAQTARPDINPSTGLEKFQRPEAVAEKYPHLNIPSSFDDYQRPEAVADMFPHLFTKWYLIRQCQQGEHNGMNEMGVHKKFRRITYIHVPRLLAWFETRNG